MTRKDKKIISGRQQVLSCGKGHVGSQIVHEKVTSEHPLGTALPELQCWVELGSLLCLLPQNHSLVPGP
jgi:hypothetical protein